jgi:hypothetical protein
VSNDSDELARRRAEIARAEKDLRRNPADEDARAAVSRLRAEYAEKRIEVYVQKVVAEAPPLTDEQKSRLASLLRPLPVTPELA